VKMLFYFSNFSDFFSFLFVLSALSKFYFYRADNIFGIYFLVSKKVIYDGVIFFLN